MAASENAIWQAIEDLRESREAHAVKHAELDGRITSVASGMADVKASLEASRKERGEQFEAIVKKLDGLSDEIVEERGARKLRKQLITWGIALISALGLGGLFLHGGGK